MRVSVLEAKTNLSNLIKLVESGKEEQVEILRYGKPVVKMVICNPTPVSKRIGVAKGRFKAPDDLDKYKLPRCLEASCELAFGYPHPAVGAYWRYKAS